MALKVQSEERFYSFIIDLVFSCLFGVVIGLGIAYLIRPIDAFGVFFLFCLGRFLYYFLLELYNGATFGKKHIQAVVVHQKGGAPSAIQILVRNLFRFLSEIIFVFTFGFLLHEKLSGTEIKKSKLRKKENYFLGVKLFLIIGMLFWANVIYEKKDWSFVFLYIIISVFLVILFVKERQYRKRTDV